jgi:hypothetical protein
MSQSHLVTHCGAREVSSEELAKVPVPPATLTYFPLPHSVVVDTVARALAEGGFQIRSVKLALSRNDARLFATMDLATPISSGVTLACGIRNSLDKSLPLGFCAGNRVFVCDNLSFRSELLVTRKHTRYGQSRFTEAICLAVQSLHQFRQAEEARIKHFRETDLSPDSADALLLRSFERKVVSAPLLPRVISEWRQPSFEEFKPRTLWSLFNAFTTVLGDRARTNPQQFAALTMSLSALLAGDAPALDVPLATSA